MDIRIIRLTRDEELRAGHETYEARGADGGTLWKADLDLGGMSPSSFREEAVWAEASVAAIGGKGVVVLLDLLSGAERCRIDVPSCFCGLSVQRVDGVEWLFVLGWTDVHAFAPGFEEQWVSRGVAVDGITHATVDGAVLHVNAEMDPPGGWFAVQLDVRTGQELAREPGFTDDYVGVYGAGAKGGG